MVDEGPLSTLRRNILGGGFNGRNLKAIEEKNDVALLNTATIGCVFQCLKIDIGDFFDCFCCDCAFHNLLRFRASPDYIFIPSKRMAYTGEIGFSSRIVVEPFYMNWLRIFSFRIFPQFISIVNENYFSKWHQ